MSRFCVSISLLLFVPRSGSPKIRLNNLQKSDRRPYIYFFHGKVLQYIVCQPVQRKQKEIFLKWIMFLTLYLIVLADTWVYFVGHWGDGENGMIWSIQNGYRIDPLPPGDVSGECLGFLNKTVTEQLILLVVGLHVNIVSPSSCHSY